MHPCITLPLILCPFWSFGNWHVVFCRPVVAENGALYLGSPECLPLMEYTGSRLWIWLYNVQPYKVIASMVLKIRDQCLTSYTYIVEECKYWRPAFTNGLRKRLVLGESQVKIFSFWCSDFSGASGLLCYSTGKISSNAPHMMLARVLRYAGTCITAAYSSLGKTDIASCCR
jgi:hypothetical protein